MNRQTERLWVITYDIQNDRIRRRVHDLLKNRGQAVQYSVFECWIQRPAMQLLRQQLQDTIEEGDSIRWYPLCNRCHPQMENQGKGDTAENTDYYLL